eukprot:4658141-Pyramimonas_sp.AAC.1
MPCPSLWRGGRPERACPPALWFDLRRLEEQPRRGSLGPGAQLLLRRGVQQSCVPARWVGSRASVLAVQRAESL